MANPVIKYQETPELGSCELHIEFPVGAAGAVGTVVRARECDPTTPVTKEAAAGTYTVNLRETWVALLGVSGGVLQGTFDKTHGTDVRLSADNVATTGKFTVECRTADGAATVANPASGDIVKIIANLQYMKQ